MRFLSKIVLCFVILITAAPLSQFLPDNSCQEICGTSKSANSEKQQVPACCCPCQACFCCVTGAEYNYLSIRVYETSVSMKKMAGKLILPGFSSDCWQPPEIC